MNNNEDSHGNYKIIKESEEKIQIVQDNCSLINIEQFSGISLTQLTSLQLINCNLIELQPVFQQLQQLKELNLSNNQLVEIPGCLYSNFKLIEILDLSYNKLTNFDIEPACCEHLKVLKLNNNSFTNIPEWCLNGQSSINLQQLVFNYNQVNQLRITRNLNNLQYLELSCCGLTDRDLIFLKNCKHLIHLDLSNAKSIKNKVNLFNNFDDIFYNLHLINLKVLNLNHLLLSIIPKSLFWLEQLVELHLNNCELSWLLSDIKYLINLELLDVSNNLISCLPDELFELEHLKILKCSYNVISILQRTFQSKQLILLDFYYNNFEQFPDNLQQEQIEFIDFEMNYFDTTTLDNYQEKKCNLRNFLNDMSRFGGKRTLEDLDDNNYSQITDNDSSSVSSDYQDFNENSNQAFLIEEENWNIDENNMKCSNDQNYQKNEEITTSDDEFIDFHLFARKTRKRSIKYFIDVDEDWVFCDAD